MPSWTTEQAKSLLFFETNVDMDTINKWIHAQPINTPRASKLKDSWIRWWDSLGWYDKNVSTAAFDEARNRRSDFQKANAVTAQEKEAVRQVLRTGLTSEETQGETRRSDAEGRYPDPPLIPEKYKVAAIATAAGVGALVLLKKLHIL